MSRLWAEGSSQTGGWGVSASKLVPGAGQRLLCGPRELRFGTLVRVFRGAQSRWTAGELEDADTSPSCESGAWRSLVCGNGVRRGHP